jgi:hypothetical protein
MATKATIATTGASRRAVPIARSQISRLVSLSMTSPTRGRPDRSGLTGKAALGTRCIALWFLKRHAAGETLAEIAKSYAVDVSMISRLI